MRELEGHVERAEAKLVLEDHVREEALDA